ncbi:hypothetical protein PR002_g23987 [Phytophthora rubi]|uniref:RNA-directed DNA polymerase n=1 Tax=Phytophthora rubi TaxID=129364 RepID=A0A6A3IH49_9STRA|nr:hypothetical protein PR002_g23987 [Phytophthora rubi]
MAAARYVRCDQRGETEEGSRDAENQRRHEAEEGGRPETQDVPTSEEGAVPTPVSKSAMGTDAGEGDATVQRDATSAEEEVATRAAPREDKKAAKKRRVQRAAAKRAAVTEAEREEEQRGARESAQQAVRVRQAEQARGELDVRRRQRREGGEKSAARVEEKARVSLVQRRRGTVLATTAREVDASDVEADDGLPTALMTVAGGKHHVKLDSGARYTVAGTDWMTRGDKQQRRAPVDYVEGIGGFLLDVLGVWSFKMYNVFGQLVKVQACIVEGCTSEFLLGVDFMKAHEATMDFSKNEIRYAKDGKKVVIPFKTFDKGGRSRIAAVRTVERARLAKRAVTPMQVSVTAADGEKGIFIPNKNCGAVMLAMTVTEARDGKAWVPVINANGGRVKLPPQKELGTWVPIDDDMKVLSLNGEMTRERLGEWIRELSSTSDEPLENEDEVDIRTKDAGGRALIMQLLRAYRKVSTNAGDCPPATALDVEHHIDTGNEAPIMLKRRRQAKTEDAIIDDNTEKMLKAGVIEEGNGAWGFPVVLVRKKDGEVRFCIDYRALNKTTKKDVYPLPRIDETLEALGGALLFTTLDLRAGYWQIRMAEADRDKTAFTTKKGLYRFIRMPFGLMNAPSTFQRLMNGVLRGLTWVTCLVYLDDIVVFTRGGIERHVIELASVLERLSAAGLTLKLKKCVFATTSMEYLGHELSCDGVRPVERLISAVKDFPRPRDPVEVKRFVHLAGYYRKFIEGFGSIMAPMTRLLRKATDWEWTEEQEFAFERMKAILTTKPLLIYPDFKRPFRLVTDASKVGLGACLMQDAGDGWKPIAYASKVNSSAEANYSITELECLTVVWSVKLFRPCLYGRVFTIVTDHSALRWLMTRPSPAGRLHRWSLTLQEYEFDIAYRPGSTNVVADALSRAPAAVLAAVGRKTRASEQRTVVDSSMTAPMVTLTMEPAEVDAVVDANRSGKSTASGQCRERRSETWSRTQTRWQQRPRTRTARRQRERRRPDPSREQLSDAQMTKHDVGKNMNDVGGRRRAAISNDEGPAAKTTQKAAKKSKTRRDSVSRRPEGATDKHPRTPTPAQEQQDAALDDNDESVPTYANETSLQMTDDEISKAQTHSKLVQTLLKAGKHQGMEVTQKYGLVLIKTPQGRRVILPPALWPKVFKEYHDSVWAGHLRGPHTYARISALYWWPRMQKEVRRWVNNCQECGSRKVRPREVVPPLRSLRGGDVGDRWALDVAGPFPIATGGQRYVIAALEYVTRYAVAATVVEHTAKSVATFLLKEVVLRFGPFRELLTDGAPELTGKAIEQLVLLMQSKQINPVPYRPQMIGLVERFHRSWKDCVATYMTEENQTDWELWVKYAVYAYNSARHSTVALTPNELMMGRKLKSPNELMLPREAAEAVAAKQRVCRASACQGAGSAGKVLQSARYENFLVRREDKTGKPEEFIAHASFLVTYHCSAEWLATAAEDLAIELEDESTATAERIVEARPTAVRATQAPIDAAAAAEKKRRRRAVAREDAVQDSSTRLVERRRRRRRNRAGQYVMEYELETERRGGERAERRWVSIAEYEQLFNDGRVVEDP